MRKQTKLVAVLSTAALLAIGASMTSFAAQGWAEEDGTWVYYDASNDRVTEQFAKSGNNWYYLDENGEMATDQLIEYKDNYYYVDMNGVMVSNKWVSIDNEDAGNDNEPEKWWYYFQASGKALKGPDNGKIALKDVNGKKYAFNDEAQMLYGWIKEDDQSIYNDDEDAWQEAIYYFGDEDDGAMTVGWLAVDITDENTESQEWIAPVFSGDGDQTRYFYFKTNGKKVQSNSPDEIKEQNLNGLRYGFDNYGRMVAEWSFEPSKMASGSIPTKEGDLGDTASNNEARIDQTRNWKYFQSVEDGRKLRNDWFQVVAAENLDTSKYEDDAAEWYYVDGSGNLYANEIRIIKGERYAFGETGINLTGLKFIQTSGNYSTRDFGDIMAPDGRLSYDTESAFNENAAELFKEGYSCYYFGSDGAMRRGKVLVDIDGDKFNFNFNGGGSGVGAGKTGLDDKKYYNSGKLMTAGKDEKYQVVYPELDGTKVIGYKKFEDAGVFAQGATKLAGGSITVLKKADLLNSFSDGKDGYKSEADLKDVDGKLYVKDVSLKDLGLSTNKLKNDEISDLSIYVHEYEAGKYELGIPTLKNGGAAVVNSSGTVSQNNSKNKDGNDVIYKLSNDKIVATFAEN